MSPKALKISLVLLATLVFGFSFRTILSEEWSVLYARYFPCRRPIVYRVVSFDARFGLSRADFEETLREAEKIWEEPIGKDLFTPSTEDKIGANDLSINLIYDYRQEATEKIKKLGLIVSDTRHSYDNLRAKYEIMQKKYLEGKAEYEKEAKAFTERQEAYIKEVNYWNSQNGAPEDKYEALNKESAELKEEYARLKDKEKELNDETNDINALITVINRLAKTLNLNASEIDKVGKTQGEEFTEGEFKTGPEGKEIDVYEFGGKDRLVRLMAHEFGHALGLDHVDDPDAIMYRLNESKSNKLSSTDITALKNYCKIE